MSLKDSFCTDEARIEGRDNDRAHRRVDGGIRQTDRTHILPGPAQR